MGTKPHILVIDSEQTVRSSLCNLFKQQSCNIVDANSLSDAINAWSISSFDLILYELNAPETLSSELIEITSQVPVVIMSKDIDIRSVVDAIQLGVADYIAKPLDHKQLLIIVEHILGNFKPNDDLRRQRAKFLIGDSPQIINIANKIQTVARNLKPVLILGEIGSGRASVARCIHESSNLYQQPFVTIDCNLINKQQLCNALKTTINKTFYFHNICELSMELQPIVTRALKQKNIRIIASTKNDLSTATALGRFNTELLFQLSVITINIPPLREHKGDIHLLVDYFIKHHTEVLGCNNKFTPQAIQTLCEYPWPGNVKQLEDIIYQALALSISDECITPSSLSLPATQLKKKLINDNDKMQFELSLEEYFIRFVSHNQRYMSETMIAKKLGISRKSLWQRRLKLGLIRE